VEKNEHGGQVLNYKFPMERYDYTQREVADHLGIYLTSFKINGDVVD
jgi:plasmid maintenance system antidote protein VapI